MLIGDAIEAYWPDDDTWLPATVRAVHTGGSLSIAWADGSESEVPSDYARHPGAISDEEAEVQLVEEERAEAGDEESELEWVEDLDADDEVQVECQKIQQQKAVEHAPRGATGRVNDAPAPLTRHRGALRDTRPAWMTKGLGVGTEMFGEATGELLKPGLTRTDLEELERTGCKDLGYDPFGQVFCESSGGSRAIGKLETLSAREIAASPQLATNELDDDSPPCFELGTNLSFDARVAAAEDIPYAAAQNPSGSFSVDFWARPQGGSGYRSPLTSRDFPPPRGYAFFLTPRGQWAFWIGMPESNEWLKIDGSAAREGEWQRLTGVYCGKSQTARLYLDGQEVGNRRASKAFEPNTQRPLRLGAGASEAGAKFSFHGSVRDIRIYSRALKLPLPLDGIGSEPPAKRRK